MLERGQIIELALITVGNITDYNDNRSNIYQLATKLLDSIADSVCKSNEFNFPSTTVQLTVSELDTNTGEHRYNIPEDFLGIKKKPIVNTRTPFTVESVRSLVRGNKPIDLRLEGEYIYSYSNPLILNYVRRLPLTEFPEYIKDYLVLMLAVKLAQTIPMYADRLPYLEIKLNYEKNNVILAEGSAIPLNLKGGVYNG